MMRPRVRPGALPARQLGGLSGAGGLDRTRAGADGSPDAVIFPASCGRDGVKFMSQVVGESPGPGAAELSAGLGACAAESLVPAAGAAAAMARRHRLAGVGLALRHSGLWRADRRRCGAWVRLPGPAAGAAADV